MKELNLFLTKDDRKISIVGGLLLLALTLITGLTVYNTMRQQIESVLGTGLTVALQGKALLFDTRIAKGIEDTQALALRPFIVQFMQELNDNLNDEIASKNLSRNINSLTQVGFSAVIAYDNNDNVLSQVGSFRSNENPSINLNKEGNIKLIWDNLFVLRTTVNVFNKGNLIGKIITETSLPNLTRSFVDIQSIGKTVEYLICSSLVDNQQAIACLISNPGSVRFAYLNPKANKSEYSPKELALEGKSGVTSALDYRNTEVIEAYTSLPLLGIVMTLKLDQEELFMPINVKLKDVIIYLAALIFAEILLLNWFIRKLISSEKEARYSKVKAEEYSIELADKEKELRKRLKEITCLYDIRRGVELGMSIDGVCQTIIKNLLPAIQYPETSVIEICVNDKRYISPNHKNSLLELKQSENLLEVIKPVRAIDRRSIFNFFIQSDIFVNNQEQGYLRVYHAQDIPGSFVEEQKLIDVVTSNLEGWLELRQLEEALVSVAEEQVHKIGQELHDNIGQQIAAIAYQASVLEVKINEVDSNITSKFSGLAASVALQTQNLVVNIKQLSKVLLPFELETNGLISALQTLATRMNTTYHIDCEFTSNIGEEDIDSVVALNIYRVAQEAVNNAIFHGKAKHVSIALNADNSEPNQQVVHLAVCDNGSGFSESFLEQNLLTGMGIKIMHYRAKQLDGELKILRRNESGVEVHFIIPIKEHDQQI